MSAQIPRVPKVALMARQDDNPVRPYRAGQPPQTDFLVSEFAADSAGPHSPFGEDVQFPLRLDHIRYVHPGRADRPHLAGGR
jgi:hypothetical protein